MKRSTSLRRVFGNHVHTVCALCVCARINIYIKARGGGGGGQKKRKKWSSELGFVGSSGREREGRPELKAFVCSFQTDLAGTPTLRQLGRGCGRVSGGNVGFFRPLAEPSCRRAVTLGEIPLDRERETRPASRRTAPLRLRFASAPRATHPRSVRRTWYVPPQLERCEQFPLETNFLQFSSLWALTL